MSTATFSFGRFNPPTSGHLMLAKRVIDVAKKSSGKAFIFTGQSTDPKRNPLDYNKKTKYMAKSFKGVEVVRDKKIKTLFDALEYLDKKGFDNIQMVVGSDRVSAFKTLVKKYMKDYNFTKFEVVSAGERDPDADGVKGMSASKMRAAVSRNDYDAFLLGCPETLPKRDCLQMFKDLKSGMGIKEDTEINEECWFDHDEYTMFVERVVSLQTRKKMARVARKTAKRRAKSRKRKEKFRKSDDKLKTLANKKAKMVLRGKLTGGKNWSDMSIAARQKIDDQLQKKSAAVSKIAKKLYPAVKKQERERLQKLRSPEAEPTAESILGEVKIVDRLVSQLKAKGMDNDKAHAVARSQLQKHGILKKGSEELTDKGKKRNSMSAGERAKDRAAKKDGKSPADYKYNKKTNIATQKEETMKESDEKPLLKWMETFRTQLKKAGSSYTKVDPVDALKLYYKGVDPKQAVASLKKGKKLKENPEYDPNLSKMNIGEMSAKQHYAKMKRGGKGKGFVVSTPIDRDRYPNRERQGLEGPYKSRKSGKIFYYDKRAGKYYDPDSDMYLQVSDVMEATIGECWDSHVQQGYKMKNGKRVPNCVPKEQVSEATLQTVHVKTNRAGYRKLESMIASLDGYKESEFEKEGKAVFRFDAKKHDGAERKKVAEFIKKTRGAEFSHAIKESVQLDEDDATKRFFKGVHADLKKVMDNKYYREFRAANDGRALDNVINHFGKSRGFRVDKTVKSIIDKYGKNRDEYIKKSFEIAGNTRRGFREEVEQIDEKYLLASEDLAAVRKQAKQLANKFPKMRFYVIHNKKHVGFGERYEIVTNVNFHMYRNMPIQGQYDGARFMNEEVELDEAPKDDRTQIAKQVKKFVKPYVTGRISVTSGKGKFPYIQVRAVGGEINNKLRKMVITKAMPKASVKNMDDISYGNVTKNYIAIGSGDWAKVMGIEEDMYDISPVDPKKKMKDIKNPLKGYPYNEDTFKKKAVRDASAKYDPKIAALKKKIADIKGKLDAKKGAAAAVANSGAHLDSLKAKHADARKRREEAERKVKASQERLAALRAKLKREDVELDERDCGRDYKKEYANFHGKPEQRAKRSKRVLARREMIKSGKAKKGDGKDVDHRDGNANNNSPSNLRMMSVAKNRSRNNNKQHEENGAGDEGTPKLVKRYKDMTPGENAKKKKTNPKNTGTEGY